jgi:predicted lysophospholipase L1 biosynthesis ABC-type transport system permease subunit
MNQHLEDIAEIRAMMERSTRFLSLSGLSGVFAGTFGLIASGLAYFRISRIITEAIIVCLKIKRCCQI